jgi:hypothetical protein
VEFVMRRDAIILAAALSLIGIEGAEAKPEIVVEKASQRMVVIRGADMAELSSGQHASRPATARTPLPSRSPPADRRVLTHLVDSVNPPRAAQPVASARPTPSIYGLRMLPASCWSGAASRWRWWGTGQDTRCK